MSRQAEGERGTDGAYASNKGNAMLSYLLNSVRRGSCSDIKVTLSSPEYFNLTQLIVGNNLSHAYKAFQYISPQIAQTAMDVGMVRTEAVGRYFSYTQKAQQASSVPALLELINQMFLDFAENVDHVKEEYQFSPLVRQCHKYISEHLCQPLTICDIAKALHISRSHLSRVYKRETGMTISDFIQHKKISEAKLLLQHTTLSLSEIGQQVGFSSQSHFTDVFHKETSMTPRQFRNKHIRWEIKTQTHTRYKNRNAH